MISSFVNTYLINEFYAIHVHYMKQQTMYHVIQLHKNKNKIKILDQFKVDDFSKLNTRLKKTIPVILSITGTNVINKIVPNQVNFLDKVLFNKNPENFYIFEQTLEDSVLLSVTRKEVTGEILKLFSDHKIDLIDFNIGPFVLEKCKPLLPETNSIRTNFFNYRFNPPTIESVQKSQGEELIDFRLGDELVKNDQIIAFSGFLNYLANDNVTNFEEITESFKENIIYKKAFSVTGLITLLLFTILLTTSYFVSSYYSTKSANIQQELAVKTDMINQIEVLKKDKEYKQSVIANSSFGSTDYLSFYLLEIASKVKGNMLLKELSVFPINGQIAVEDKIAISPKIILVKGVTTTKNSVNDLVKDLDKLKWITKIDVTSYMNVNNEYQFSINLYL